MQINQYLTNELLHSLVLAMEVEQISKVGWLVRIYLMGISTQYRFCLYLKDYNRSVAQ